MVGQSERDGGDPLADLWFNSHVRRYGSRLSGSEKQPFLMTIENATKCDSVLSMLAGRSRSKSEKGLFTDGN